MKVWVCVLKESDIFQILMICRGCHFCLFVFFCGGSSSLKMSEVLTWLALRQPQDTTRFKMTVQKPQKNCSEETLRKIYALTTLDRVHEF